ncbi:hypothetical protein N0V84_010465 [Fusarium piperis]|uniref:Uncharacterized protein n=1 Tax=Fusarium piperis TaxID=1435070 RepID=A0A9W8TG16_9HYPO|nr:hypothetical protein N0V84_010465 [Fusarium piperis]
MTRPLGQATGAEKLKIVTDLIEKLHLDVENIRLLPSDRDIALEELKIYSRDPENAGPIFSERGINALLRHAFFSPSTKTARGALRVLVNAMVLKPETRQIFIDKGFARRACRELKGENFDDEFLNSRILLLSTYETMIDLEELIDEHRLAEYIVEKLNRHAKDLSNKAVDILGRHARFLSSKPKSKSRSKSKTDPMQGMALSETSKLLYVVSHICPDRISALSTAVPHLVFIFLKHPIPEPKPLEGSFKALISAFANLDFGAEKSKAALYPKGNISKVADKLIDILNRAVRAYADTELDEFAAPSVKVIRKLYINAPALLKKHMRGLLLPTVEDRVDELGTRDTLPGKLLKHLTSRISPVFRVDISDLFLEMSDRDANKYVENVGYGFAGGLFLQKSMPIPASATEAFSGGAGGPQEPRELTQEEKDRQTEQLFELFDQLNPMSLTDGQEEPKETITTKGQPPETKDGMIVKAKQ